METWIKKFVVKGPPRATRPKEMQRVAMRYKVRSDGERNVAYPKVTALDQARLAKNFHP